MIDDAQRSLSRRTSVQPDALRQAFLDQLRFGRGRALGQETALDRYVALALSVRDRLVQQQIETEKAYQQTEAKRVNYLSAEFLLGRALRSNLQALGMEESYRTALAELNLDLDAMLDQEPEPGLGNGGLGRLAACFLESMATLSLPGQGYGIRYEFGIFEQIIRGGQQVERADEWLRFGTPWELARPELAVTVKFGGQTRHVADGEGGFKVVWQPADTVLGVPHDVFVAGFRNGTVNTLRLWAAKSGREFDFALFNAGDYVRAVEGKNASEVISKVLYPNDNFNAGRELRLRQEYFFVACSIQDIVQQHLQRYDGFSNFADKTAIQLNDTHPAVAVAELMRVLLDEHSISWDRAWGITQASFGFTNHTLMPEALERWSVDLFDRLLPRHLEIIREVDRRFAHEVLAAHPDDLDRARRMAIIDDANPPHIHMARLALVGSHKVNGVAQLHSELLKTRVMKDFYELYPERFSNKTNGVTPRRWIVACNPQLSELVSERLKTDDWMRDLDQLRGLEKHIDDPAFLTQLRRIKKHHKLALAAEIEKLIGLQVDASAIFDVHIKRLHEYKRQLLNALHIASLYFRAKAGEKVASRVFIFGAKAAPGYRQAKRIIRLIHDMAEVINNDPQVPELKVAFLPNYRVTLAERIIPAADVSEQISTAGKEASGTGNMKLSLNGALTMGTLDGANIEIREAVGEENFFLFGLTEGQVKTRLAADSSGRLAYEGNPELKAVVDRIADGFFTPDEPERYRAMFDALLDHDAYAVMADFASYAACQRALAQVYADPDRWARMSALNIARIGRFSSDRTIREYARDIWQIQAVPVDHRSRQSDND